MGVLDFFSNWLSGIFFAKNQTQTVLFSELDDFLLEQQKPAWKSFEETAVLRIPQIKSALRELNQELLAFEKQSPEKGSQRIQKIVAGTQATTINRLKSVVSKLEPPKALEKKRSFEFAQRAFPTLQAEISAIGKNIAYSSVLFKDEIASLGKPVAVLEEASRDLYEKTQLPAFEASARIESFSQKISEISNNLSELTKEAKSQEEKIKKHQEEFQRIQLELAAFRDSPQANQIKELEAELAKLDREQALLKDRFLSVIGKADKPLKRFGTVVSSGHWALDSTARIFLERFLSVPWETIQSDPKGEQFKIVLSELEQALAQKKVSSKDEAELEKWAAAIRELKSYDFFSEVFWKQNNLLSQKQKIQKELSGFSAAWKIKEQQVALEKKAEELKAAREALVLLQTRQAKAADTLSAFKNGLEKELSEFSGKNIVLELN